jgi:raffinose/stachyose/melibiose transport system permease protein
MSIKHKQVAIKFITIPGRLLLASLFFMPLYIPVVYAFKSKSEIAFTGLQFPKKLLWSNFPQAVEATNFFRALGNSIITTIPVVIMLTLFCCMGAYIIARRNTVFFNVLYYTMVGAMLIPFQVIMTPLYMNLKSVGLINNLFGFIYTRTGFGIAFSLLVVTSFVKLVPAELEDAAAIDGANRYQSFFLITFRLMQPIICTLVVLNFLYTWNDFQVANVILQSERIRTIPLMQFYFFGVSGANLNLAFAMFLMSMIPIIILYLAMQKYIISGITAGAIKG